MSGIILDLVKFLKDAGYSSVAENVLDGATRADELRKLQDDGSVLTEQETDFLKQQDTFEANLRTLS